jgi:hypothetical protein
MRQGLRAKTASRERRSFKRDPTSWLHRRLRWQPPRCGTDAEGGRPGCEETAAAQSAKSLLTPGSAAIPASDQAPISITGAGIARCLCKCFAFFTFLTVCTCAYIRKHKGRRGPLLDFLARPGRVRTSSQKKAAHSPVHFLSRFGKGPSGTPPSTPGNETLVPEDWPSSPLPISIGQYRIDIQGQITFLWTKPLEPLSCPRLAPRRPRLG